MHYSNYITVFIFEMAMGQEIALFKICIYEANKCYTSNTMCIIRKERNIDIINLK